MTTTPTSLTERIATHQMRLPGLDGYTAERLNITLAGNVDLLTNDATEVAFIDSLKLGQEIELRVTATVTGKGFKYTTSKDGEDGTAGYNVGLKVHSLDLE